MASFCVRPHEATSSSIHNEANWLPSFFTRQVKDCIRYSLKMRHERLRPCSSKLLQTQRSVSRLVSTVVVSEIIGKSPVNDDVYTGLLDPGVCITQHETVACFFIVRAIP